ncbi:alpha/beta fold hydrolase [Streptomyces cellulosae]
MLDAGSGRTTVEDLASLLLNLVDHHGIDRFHSAAISPGGAIGAHLALHHPERVASPALVCSSAHVGAVEAWQKNAPRSCGAKEPDTCSPLVLQPYFAIPAGQRHRVESTDLP